MVSRSERRSNKKEAEMNDDDAEVVDEEMVEVEGDEVTGDGSGDALEPIDDTLTADEVAAEMLGGAILPDGEYQAQSDETVGIFNADGDLVATVAPGEARVLNPGERQGPLPADA